MYTCCGHSIKVLTDVDEGTVLLGKGLRRFEAKVADRGSGIRDGYTRVSETWGWNRSQVLTFPRVDGAVILHRTEISTGRSEVYDRTSRIAGPRLEGSGNSSNDCSECDERESLHGERE